MRWRAALTLLHCSCKLFISSYLHSVYRLEHLNLACGSVACLMLPLLLVALYTMRKEQHGPIPTTRANVEQHQDPATPQQESSSQLRYSDQEYEADDHCRLNQCLKVSSMACRIHYESSLTIRQNRVEHAIRFVISFTIRNRRVSSELAENAAKELESLSEYMPISKPGR